MKKALADALDQRGYSTLTPVQQAVTQPELDGADLLVSAQTGSGKTLGFGLAIAPTLLGEDEVFAPAGLPLALVIAPTRELALQVKRELAWLFAQAGAVLASCVGGMDMRDERRALQRGAHIVVATPGRLRDHIMRGSIELNDLRAVVLDEADEMLDLGFREDLEFILGAAPEHRQTLMFSATVPKTIAHLAKSYQRDAVRITTASEASQHADIEYRALSVSARDAENAIINVLRYYEAPNALVFGNTRDMVNRMTTRLSNRGFSVVSLSGELSQSERTHALQAMRDGRARICVATDVAARGIDLPNLDLVVHAELPSNHETLLHRSGRTGRAGRKGVSVLIVPPSARKKAERILHFAKLKADWSEAPSAEAVMERDEQRMLEDPSWTEEISETEAGTVQKLVEHFSAEQIAAAFLRLRSAHHSAPEDLSAVDDKPVPRVEFGPSKWFALAGGRETGAEPRRVLPVLCKQGGLTKNDIGAIRVQQTETFVEIKASSVPAFLNAVGTGMTLENAALRQLDAPPGFAKPARPDTGRKPSRPEYSAKPKEFKPRAEKPEVSVAVPTDAPATEAPVVEARAEKHGTTKPVDWNDAPAPRARKPKPAAPGAGPKKPYKAKSDRPEHPEGAVIAKGPGKFGDGNKKPYKPRAERSEGGESRPSTDGPKKPRHKPDGKFKGGPAGPGKTAGFRKTAGKPGKKPAKAAAPAPWKPKK